VLLQSLAGLQPLRTNRLLRTAAAVRTRWAEGLPQKLCAVQAGIGVKNLSTLLGLICEDFDVFTAASKDVDSNNHVAGKYMWLGKDVELCFYRCNNPGSGT
jgi:hypothetical protein